MTYLDTHVVVWLYARRLDLLSEHARNRIEGDDLAISPMVILELDFLGEVGKIAVGGSAICQSLHSRLGLKTCDQPFSQVIDEASKQRWTRDPFDRIIVAQAARLNAELLTRDELIRQHYPRACW